MKLAIYNLLLICLVTFLINLHEAKKSSRPKSGLSKPIRNGNEVAKRRLKNQNKGVKKGKNLKNKRKSNLRKQRRKKNKSKNVARRKPKSKKYPSKQKRKQKIKNNINKKFPSKKKKKGKKQNKKKQKNLNKQKLRKGNKGKKRNRKSGNEKKSKTRKGKKKNKKRGKLKKNQIKINGKYKQRTEEERKNKRNGKQNKNRNTNSRKNQLDQGLQFVWNETLDYDPRYLYPYVNKARPKFILHSADNRYKYKKMEWFDDSIIYLTYSKTWDDVSFNDDKAYYDKIERCYNSYQRCVAFWSGECLKDRYKGNILGILMVKTTTYIPTPCELWNPRNDSFIHNQCISFRVTHLNTGNPMCTSIVNLVPEGVPCFHNCDYDIRKKILTFENGITTLDVPNNNGDQAVVNWKNATALTLELHPFSRTKNVITIDRCFDSSWHCVALGPGKCIEKKYSYSLAYVLLNSRNSLSGKSCWPWTNTLESKHFRDPNHNICFQSKDRGGPWCYIDANHNKEFCFPECPGGEPFSGDISSEYDTDAVFSHNPDDVFGKPAEVQHPPENNQHGCNAVLLKPFPLDLETD